MSVVRLTALIVGVILAASLAANAQQRPSHKPPPPSAGQTGGPLQAQPTDTQSRVARDQRGTEQAPLVVETHNGPKTEAEAAEAAAEKERKALSDWWTISLAFALVVATGMQFIALIFQGWQLRRSVDVAAQASVEAKDAIRATQASAEAANIHARAAEEANRINREILIASQRAWLRVVDAKIGASQPLRFDENGAAISIAYTIENIGNAPALYINIHQWLIVLTSSRPVSEIQQEKCEPIRRSRFAYGFTLFPNEVHPAASGYREFSFGIAASKQDVEEGRRATTDGKYVILHIVGCIDYTFPSDPSVHHQTGFLYELRKTSLAPISPDDGVIDPANLVLQPDALGAGRYAD